MAEVKVTLDAKEVEEACKYWATHRVLNQGQALGCEVSIDPDRNNGTADIGHVSVWVKTDKPSC